MKTVQTIVDQQTSTVTIPELVNKRVVSVSLPPSPLAEGNNEPQYQFTSGTGTIKFNAKIKPPQIVIVLYSDVL